MNDFIRRWKVCARTARAAATAATEPLPEAPVHRVAGWMGRGRRGPGDIEVWWAYGRRALVGSGLGLVACALVLFAGPRDGDSLRPRIENTMEIACSLP